MNIRAFEEIYAIAAARKGGDKALEGFLVRPLPARALREIPDHRWLSMMSKCIFQAGFSWQVIEAKWPAFEEAFDGFEVGRCVFLNDEDIERLLANKAIVRNGMKIRTVQENAVFVADLAKAHGSAGAFFAAWPKDDYIGLLDLLKVRGARLGGSTAQFFLRFMQVDGFVLSKDVIARLIMEDVIEKPPTSKAAMKVVQAAFSEWAEQSGRSFTEISRILAMSVD